MINTLVLPIAGRAERILSLPKYLLPISSDLTLIGNHIQSAIEAGFDELVIIARAAHSELLKDRLQLLSPKIKLVFLDSETRTMCETLLNGGLPCANDRKITVSLSDTLILGDNLTEIYSKIVNSELNQLVLFKPRDDQRGKLGQVLLGNQNQIAHLRDKSMESPYPWIWGIAAFSSNLLLEIDPLEAHVGISIEKWVGKEIYFEAVISDGQYFDCGTFEEYSKAIVSLNEGFGA